MNKKRDPLASILEGKSPKDVNELRTILEEGMDAAGANDDLPVIGDFRSGIEISKKENRVLSTDIHSPQGEGPFPVLVYFHGGGWFAGSPKSHRKICHRFAEAGYLVFNVDYALAPENPFPEGLNDCMEAIRWVFGHCNEFGGDSTRLSVGGDSAGGNLTAAAAVALADDNKVTIQSILLIYAVVDFAGLTDTEGDQTEVRGVDLMSEMMIGSYLGADRNRALLLHPRISPIHAAEKFPPTHVLCGTNDGLIASSRALVQKLRKSNIECEEFYYEGMPHGFLHFEEMFSEASQAIKRMINFLGKFS